MTNFERLCLAGYLVGCSLVFLAGATLILQSKTPPLMKRCFYGMLSLPAVLLGIGLAWGMIRNNGFNQVTLLAPLGLVAVGIHWARMAFKKTTVMDVIAEHRTSP